MTVHFDPANRPAPINAPPVIIPAVRPAAPLGIGVGICTLRPMTVVKAEDRGCCFLWYKLCSLWKWLTEVCFPPTLEELQETFNQKIELILEDHFSDLNLDRIPQPEWKTGVVLELDGARISFQFGQTNRDGAPIFRNQAFEVMKNELERRGDLTSASKLSIETLFMTRFNEENSIISLTDSALRNKYPTTQGRGVTIGMTNEETAEYLERFPALVRQFFLNP